MEGTSIVCNGRELPVTKIYVPNEHGAWIQITLTNNHGGQKLETLNALAALAADDMEGRNLRGVAAVVLGGPRRKHMWGIEAYVDKGPMPDGYQNLEGENILAGGV